MRVKVFLDLFKKVTAIGIDDQVVFFKFSFFRKMILIEKSRTPRPKEITFPDFYYDSRKTTNPWRKWGFKWYATHEGVAKMVPSQWSRTYVEFMASRGCLFDTKEEAEAVAKEFLKILAPNIPSNVAEFPPIPPEYLY